MSTISKDQKGDAVLPNYIFMLWLDVNLLRTRTMPCAVSPHKRVLVWNVAKLL